MNFIILSGLNIYNIGNTLTFRSRVREAVIDITLSNINRSMIRVCRNFDCSFSTHQLI